MSFIAAILEAIMKSKSFKVGAGAISGGVLIALILSLHSGVMAKIDKQENEQKEYVLLVLEPVKTEIAHLKEDQKEIKNMVRDIHNYLLKSKTK